MEEEGTVEVNLETPVTIEDEYKKVKKNEL